MIRGAFYRLFAAQSRIISAYYAANMAFIHRVGSFGFHCFADFRRMLKR